MALLFEERRLAGRLTPRENVRPPGRGKNRNPINTSSSPELIVEAMTSAGA
jgi:hypothetical protein